MTPSRAAVSIFLCGLLSLNPLVQAADIKNLGWRLPAQGERLNIYGFEEALLKQIQDLPPDPARLALALVDFLAGGSVGPPSSDDSAWLSRVVELQKDPETRQALAAAAVPARALLREKLASHEGLASGLNVLFDGAQTPAAVPSILAATPAPKPAQGPSREKIADLRAAVLQIKADEPQSAPRNAVFKALSEWGAHPDLMFILEDRDLRKRLYWLANEGPTKTWGSPGPRRLHMLLDQLLPNSRLIEAALKLRPPISQADGTPTPEGIAALKAAIKKIIEDSPTLEPRERLFEFLVHWGSHPDLAFALEDLSLRDRLDAMARDPDRYSPTPGELYAILERLLPRAKIKERIEATLQADREEEHRLAPEREAKAREERRARSLADVASLSTYNLQHRLDQANKVLEPGEMLEGMARLIPQVLDSGSPLLLPSSDDPWGAAARRRDAAWSISMLYTQSGWGHKPHERALFREFARGVLAKKGFEFGRAYWEQYAKDEGNSFSFALHTAYVSPIKALFAALAAKPFLAKGVSGLPEAYAEFLRHLRLMASHSEQLGFFDKRTRHVNERLEEIARTRADAIASLAALWSAFPVLFNPETLDAIRVELYSAAREGQASLSLSQQAQGMLGLLPAREGQPRQALAPANEAAATQAAPEPGFLKMLWPFEGAAHAIQLGALAALAALSRMYWQHEMNFPAFMITFLVVLTPVYLVATLFRDPRGKAPSGEAIETAKRLDLKAFQELFAASERDADRFEAAARARLKAAAEENAGSLASDLIDAFHGWDSASLGVPLRPMDEAVRGFLADDAHGLSKRQVKRIMKARVAAIRRDSDRIHEGELKALAQPIARELNEQDQDALARVQALAKDVYGDKSK